MNNTIKKVSGLTASAMLLAFSTQAQATPFGEIRIGDKDGFGYNADANFAALTGDGGLIDRNSNGTLDIGEVLASLNGDAVVATGSGDDFDNRSGETINGSGFTDNGSTGTAFTDIALSTSYDASKAANNVYNANTSSFGAGGAFPAPSSTSLPNQPGFLFDFNVTSGDIVAGTDIFFNLVFADYDVTPAAIDITFASGTKTLALSPQNNGPDDGLIQGAFVALDFADVFTWNGSSWDGYADVDFDAPNEPYTAFDYVELSVDKIVVGVPEPGTLAMFALGLMGLGFSRRKA